MKSLVLMVALSLNPGATGVSTDGGKWGGVAFGFEDAGYITIQGDLYDSSYSLVTHPPVFETTYVIMRKDGSFVSVTSDEVADMILNWERFKAEVRWLQIMGPIVIFIGFLNLILIWWKR